MSSVSHFSLAGIFVGSRYMFLVYYYFIYWWDGLLNAGWNCDMT